MRISEVLVDEVIKHNNKISDDWNIICCIEEMSELTKVLTKKLRKSPKFSREKVLEEVSHVLLMCSAIAWENAISDEEIYEEQRKAILRMNESKKGE